MGIVGVGNDVLGSVMEPIWESSVLVGAGDKEGCG